MYVKHNTVNRHKKYMALYFMKSEKGTDKYYIT